MRVTYRLSKDRKTLTFDLAIEDDADRAMVDNVLPDDPYASQRIIHLVGNDGIQITLKRETARYDSGYVPLESMGWLGPRD